MPGTSQAWLHMPEGYHGIRKIVDKFNNKSPKMTYQAQTRKPVSKRVTNYFSSNQVSTRRVYFPSISNSTLNSTVAPAPIAKNVLLMPNCVATIPTSKGYINLYSSDYKDDPVFKEMFSNFKTVKSINTFSVVL